jgi:hypothetical protein
MAAEPTGEGAGGNWPPGKVASSYRGMFDLKVRKMFDLKVVRLRSKTGPRLSGRARRREPAA